MISIYPFTILQCFVNQEIIPNIIDFFPKEKSNIKIMICNIMQSKQMNFPIHLFLFYLDKDPYHTIQFIKTIQNSSKYRNYPIIIFSYNKNYLLNAFFQLKPFQAILLPITEEISNNLSEYIYIYYNMYKTSYKKTLELNSSSCSYHFSIDDILFAEARNRKVFIYTENNTITEVPITFQHFLELIPDNTLIQSHRSYIINPYKILKIDKSSRNWTVSFYNTDKKAFISRPYRQITLNAISTYMFQENYAQVENYPMIDMYYFRE
ncbi:LytTR family transcriptional regulator [Clostridium sp. ASF356]|nr:LytTR family transcriptional regulator [Clostridium sp. MD294]USF30863.1 hypothetical protein C820_002307 [Clostridium sp. MD294]